MGQSTKPTLPLELAKIDSPALPERVNYYKNMAQPNGLNPSFGGRVKATGFEGSHLHGVSATAVDTNGTTVVNVFDSVLGISGTITGMYIIAKGGGNATITLSNGATVGTIASGTSTGAVLGCTNLDATNSTFAIGGTLGVKSSSAVTPSGAATVFVTYIVSN